MAREEHLVRMGEDSNKYRNLVGRPEGRNHSEHLHVYERIILKWILGK
jgi:hypothetical protein